MKNPVVITMLVIALVLIGGVVAVFLLLNSCEKEAAPTSAPTVAPAPVPALVSTLAPTSSTVEDKLKSLGEAIEKVRATGQAQEVTINLTEAEVNAQASQSITQETQSSDYKVASVKIDLKSNNIMSAELQAQALGFTVPIRVNMSVSVKDDRPAVTVTDISFGLIQVPQSMKDQITATIASSIDNLVVEMTRSVAGSDVELEFEAITIKETDMTIVVLVEPA